MGKEEVFAGCPEEFSLGRHMCPPIAGEVDLRVCILGEEVSCGGLEGDHHHQQGPRSKI